MPVHVQPLGGTRLPTSHHSPAGKDNTREDVGLSLLLVVFYAEYSPKQNFHHENGDRQVVPSHL